MYNLVEQWNVQCKFIVNHSERLKGIYNLLLDINHMWSYENVFKIILNDKYS